jgi:CYTH domain-containing protein
MNKTAQTELHRLFLIEVMPEPLTPASSHLQIFDNYIENTRLRLRQIRDPYSNAWTRILQSRHVGISEHEGEYAVTKLAEIHLNDEEYAVFERCFSLGDREIRKNRYFHEFDRVSFAFDVFLGDLWGLNTARVDFDTREHMIAFLPPPFAIFEVTENVFFTGENLVGKTFADVQAEVASVGAQMPQMVAEI